MSIGTTTEAQAASFDQHRPFLFGIAWRMLGNPADAEDLLQEALLRWTRLSPQQIRSPRAFLVTMVTRLCLNHLDLAHVKKELPFDLEAAGDWPGAADASPANDADLAEALDAAFSVVLKCLTPVERAVFLLREVFECDYAEVARIVEKSEDNCRQIFSRARERIAGRDSRFQVSIEQQETALREFLSATTTGDLDRLAKALAGDATLVADGENLGAPPPPPIHGATAIARFLAGTIHKLLLEGARFRQSRFGEVPLLLAWREGKLVNALGIVLRAGQVRAVYLVNCPVRLRSIDAQLPATERGESPNF
jgi:RNA polymerase sigma-70 factor (ECF subfamily)